ncbi:hypothetical protein KO465_00960 [Candidatus Micrarchaeota archaeon]|nr:hypothetical protein [Candidatus Micrarchaeota archaeon]
MEKDPEVYYYKLITKRYSQYINQKEQKSITSLKQMINPKDETVLKLISKFSEDEGTPIAQQICDYLSSLKTLNTDITFWPTFEEINFIKIGDPTDKALFGCSLFIAAGMNSKICITENEEKYLVYDIEQTRYFYSIKTKEIYQGTELDFLLSKGVKFKYCFNHQQYKTYD